jgi:hypothetical protein
VLPRLDLEIIKEEIPKLASVKNISILRMIPRERLMVSLGVVPETRHEASDSAPEQRWVEEVDSSPQCEIKLWELYAGGKPPDAHGLTVCASRTTTACCGQAVLLHPNQCLRNHPRFGHIPSC